MATKGKCSITDSQYVYTAPKPILYATDAKAIYCLGDTVHLVCPQCQTIYTPNADISGKDFLNYFIDSVHTIELVGFNNLCPYAPLLLEVAENCPITGLLNNNNTWTVGMMPNPVQSGVEVLFSSSKKIDYITVINSIGQIYTEIALDEVQFFPMNIFDKGIYLIQLYSGGNVKCEKLVVE